MRCYFINDKVKLGSDTIARFKVVTDPRCDLRRDRMSSIHPLQGLGIESSLAEALAKIEIPPRPVLLDKVMAEMNHEEPDFRRLANLILTDVGMSASLIKTANAPIFGYRTKATTVRDALTMLGLINVLRTVAGLSLRKAVPESPALQGFWETSARVAYLSGWLARELGIRDCVRSEDAYTFGLFRDCGIPILLNLLEGYEQVLAAAHAEPRLSFTAVEAGHHALNHAVVGSVMAHSWFLPDLHVQAILHHHGVEMLSPTPSSEQLPPGGRRLIALTQLAEKLQADASRTPEHEWSKVAEPCLEVLGIPTASVAVLQPAAEEILRQIE